MQAAKEDTDVSLDLDEDTGGFLFNRLIKRKPEHADSLRMFKHGIVASLEDDHQPLKVFKHIYSDTLDLYSWMDQMDLVGRQTVSDVYDAIT